MEVPEKQALIKILEEEEAKLDPNPGTAYWQGFVVGSVKVLKGVREKLTKELGVEFPEQQ